MNNSPSLRGAKWLSALTQQTSPLAGFCPSVRVVDSPLAGQIARFIAVVPDENNRFPRARGGEVGLLEGWSLAKVLQQTQLEDSQHADKRPIIAIIDVPSQAYGRCEEAFALHQALAAASAAYAQARLAGHPIIGLIVGKAMSGAFLAHGYQANRLIAFNYRQVEVHAMGKAAAARITLRSVEQVEQIASHLPPMAYDIGNYQQLGLLYQLLDIQQPDEPQLNDIQCVQRALVQAIEDSYRDPSWQSRFSSPLRQASRLVHQQMRASW